MLVKHLSISDNGMMATVLQMEKRGAFPFHCSCLPHFFTGGYSWTFDDLAENTLMGDDVIHTFFHHFIKFGSKCLCFYSCAGQVCIILGGVCLLILAWLLNAAVAVRRERLTPFFFSTEILLLIMQ